MPVKQVSDSTQVPSTYIPPAKPETEIKAKRHKPLTSAIEEEEVKSTVAAPEVNETPQTKKDDIYDSGEVNDADILAENTSAFLDALAG